MIDVENTTAERIWAAIRCPSDPSSTLPEWSITTDGRTDPGTFHPGLWASDWDARNGRVEVQSPLCGAGQTLDIASGVVHDLWLRFTPASEAQPQLLRVGSIRGL